MNINYNNDYNIVINENNNVNINNINLINNEEINNEEINNEEINNDINYNSISNNYLYNLYYYYINCDISYITYFLTSSIILSWIIGLFFINTITFNLFEPISPNAKNLQFYIIDSNCVNSKYSIYKYFSYNFVHSGLLHLIFNSFTLLIYGNITENTSSKKFIPILFVFFGGSIYAAIIYMIYAPTEILAGASCGIYALMGYFVCNYYLHINNIEQLLNDLYYPIATQKILYIITLIIFISELLIFVFIIILNINTNIGYLGHIMGFIFGYMYRICIIKNNNNNNKLSIQYAILLLFIIFSSLLLILYFFTDFPLSKFC